MLKIQKNVQKSAPKQPSLIKSDIAENGEQEQRCTNEGAESSWMACHYSSMAVPAKQGLHLCGNSSCFTKCVISWCLFLAPALEPPFLAAGNQSRT